MLVAAVVALVVAVADAVADADSVAVADAVAVADQHFRRIPCTIAAALG